MIALAQGVHVIFVSLLAGVTLFAAVAIPPDVFKSATIEQGQAQSIQKCLDRLIVLALIVSMASAMICLWAVAAAMSGIGLTEPGIVAAIRRVLTETEFGHLWLGRFAVAAALGVFAAVCRGRLVATSRLGISTVLSLILLGSIAGAGHPAAAQNYAVAVGTQAGHLFAAGIWFGGLVALWLTLGLVRPPHGAQFTIDIVKRFGAVALGSVVILAVSGTIAAVSRLATPASVVTSPYGLLLIAKTVLFAAALALAADSRWRKLPRLSSAVGESHGTGCAHLSLMRNTSIEIIVVGAILLLAGWLAVTSPPHMHG